MQTRNHRAFLGTTLRTLCAVALTVAASTVARAQNYLFNDSHFHLTNYICEGTDIHDYMKIMGNTVGRSTLFGIPLQQQWSYANSGDFAPYYYTQTDAPLYYYSFTDAYIAMAYKSLTPAEQARLDPCITGFNPTDMYAADHIKRVLKTFPGVFDGIGEFTIHKEFVSSKVSGEVATINNKALDRILDFAGEVGLVVIFHCDADSPFPRSDQPPYILEQLGALFRRHPNTKIVWAHMGVGRIVRPIKGQLAIVDKALAGSDLSHVCIDISWDEVAKYVVASPESVKAMADFINKYQDRIVFGSDCVAPKSIDNQMAVYNMYKPLWDALKPDVRQKVLKGNYERLFNEARVRVRAWEKANVGKPDKPGETTPSSGPLP